MALEDLVKAQNEYKVILPRIELVNPEAQDIFAKFGDRFNREELYCYGIGMIRELDMIEFDYYLTQADLYDAMFRFGEIIRDHYAFSIPLGLDEDECFSLRIEDYNDSADLYIFTREVPANYAEKKYGIDFGYIGQFFTQ